MSLLTLRPLSLFLRDPSTGILDDGRSEEFVRRDCREKEVSDEDIVAVVIIRIATKTSEGRGGKLPLTRDVRANRVPSEWIRVSVLVGSVLYSSLHSFLLRHRQHSPV